MRAPTLEITSEGPIPDDSALLNSDVAHAFSDLADVTLTDPLGCLTARVPDETFLGINQSRSLLTCSPTITPPPTLTHDGLIANHGGKISHQQERAIMATNQYIREIDPTHTHLFIWRDAPRFDFKAFYSTEAEVPVFQYCRHRGYSGIIQPLAGHHSFPSGNIPSLVDNKSFTEKQSKLFWRGTFSGSVFVNSEMRTTYGLVNRVLNHGGSTSMSELRHFSRFGLIYDLTNTDFSDVGFSQVPLIMEHKDPLPESLTIIRDLMRTPIPQVDQLNYRYLLALDGTDGPSSLYWMLNTNSVVFRQESVWELYGDNYLTPWIHYIPITLDINDIMNKFEWCEKNLSKCVEIADNAKAAWRLLFDAKLTKRRVSAVFDHYNYLLS